jgi:hypothetical protein
MLQSSTVIRAVMRFSSTDSGTGVVWMVAIRGEPSNKPDGSTRVKVAHVISKYY